MEGCELGYSFQIVDVANTRLLQSNDNRRLTGSKSDGAVTFNSETRDFKVFWLDDLIPSDGSSADYEVTIIANQKEGGTTELRKKFNLSIKNPCLNPETFEIMQPLTLPQDQNYTLANETMEIDAENLLMIVTKPIKTEICMIGVQYKILFEDEKVTKETKPIHTMVLNDERICVGLYTDNQAMIGNHTLEIVADIVYEPYGDVMPQPN